MLAFAFLGGFILNVMPCVLPVISIKILSFVQQADEEPKRVFRLGLFFSLVLPGVCPSVEESLAKERCVDALRETLDEFRPNVAAALDRLREADPDLKIVVMTLYNPFSGGLEPIDVIVELALEGEPDGPFPEGLNDIIRAVAEERGLTLVDWHPLFEGKAGEYIAGDLIHPNDDGYRVMADAVLEAVR